jgi:hypothetical protein
MRVGSGQRVVFTRSGSEHLSGHVGEQLFREQGPLWQTHLWT